MSETVKVMLDIPEDMFREMNHGDYLEVVTRNQAQQYLHFFKAKMSNMASNPVDADKIANAIQNTLSTGIKVGFKVVSGVGSGIISGVASAASGGLPVSEITTITSAASAGFSLSNLLVSVFGFRKMDKKLNTVIKLLNKQKRIGYLVPGLTVANMAVSAAGFVIINRKINDLSRRIDDIATKIDRIDRKMDNAIIQEYQKLALQFSNMTALIEGHGQVESRVALEWLSSAQPFMNKLINNLLSNAMDKGMVLEMLFTLLPAYTATLIAALREYKFETGRSFGAVDGYLALYHQLLELRLIDETSAHLFMDEKLHAGEALTAVQVQNQIVQDNLKQVQDEIALLEKIETREEYETFKRAVLKLVRESVEECVPEIARQAEISPDACEDMVARAFEAVG